MWLEVRSKRWMLTDCGHGLVHNDTHHLWSEDKTWWTLMQLPEFEIVRRSLYDEIDTDDVTYSAMINEHAKENLELETICGTAEGGVPLARGAYMRTATRSQVEHLWRAGRTATAEELLIGTLYSQFAERKNRLEGTVLVPTGDLCCYEEAMQGDRRFIATKDIENVQQDVAECVFVELRPDEYDKEDGE